MPTLDDYSDVSDEFDDDERPPMPYIAESRAVKPADKTIHSDEWPEVRLEDASITYPDGSIANLLNAALQGPFTVRGRIQVEGQSLNNLSHKKYNGKYIEIRNCTLYSISLPPFQIWAEGAGGWFEILPSPKYYDTYKVMWEAVRMYYFVTEIYERCLNRKKQLDDISEILYKWALSEGTGLINGGHPHENVAERFKAHAEFLLGQIGRSGSIFSNRGKYRQSWLTSPFYKWLINEVPDVHARYEKRKIVSGDTPFVNDSKVKLSPRSDLKRHNQPASRTHTDILKPETERSFVQKKLTKESRTLHESGRGRNNHSPIVIDDTSEPYDTEEENSDVEYKRIIVGNKPLRWRPHARDQRARDVRIMVKVLESEHASGKRPKHRQTMSTLGTQLYYDYGFGAPLMAHIVVRANAQALLAHLGDSWKKTSLVEELKREVSGKTTSIIDKDEAYLRSIVPEYMVKARRKKEPKADISKASGKHSGLKRQQIQKASSVSQKPAIASAKLLTLGSSSGKAPGLRLPGTSKRKIPPITSLLEIETDEERNLIEEAALSNLQPPILDHPPKNPFSDRRKRRRVFSPSQGHQRTPPPEGRPRPDLTAWNGEPDLSSPSVTPEPETDGNNHRDPEFPPPLVLKEKKELAILTAPLPSIEESTTGPRRTFRCMNTNCKFTLDDAENSLAVREKIRAHWRRHAEDIDKVQRDVAREFDIRRKVGQKNVEMQATHLMEKILKIGKGVREREEQLMATTPGLFPEGGRTGGFAADGRPLQARIARAGY